MTEQEKNLIIRLWGSGEPITSIVRLLPYKKTVARAMVMELRQNGVLQGRSGKSKAKTCGKVLQAYNDGITNPYEISNMLSLKVSTVKRILIELQLKRQRPKHNYKAKKLCDKTKEIIEEIESGKPLSEIAKSHGFSKQYVYSVRNKFVRGNNNE